jgi:hypothetical protein
MTEISESRMDKLDEVYPHGRQYIEALVFSGRWATCSISIGLPSLPLHSLYLFSLTFNNLGNLLSLNR